MATFHSYDDYKITFITDDRIQTIGIGEFIDQLHSGGAYSWQRTIAAGLIEHILNMTTAGKPRYISRSNLYKHESDQSDHDGLKRDG